MTDILYLPCKYVILPGQFSSLKFLFIIVFVYIFYYTLGWILRRLQMDKINVEIHWLFIYLNDEINKLVDKLTLIQFSFNKPINIYLVAHDTVQHAVLYHKKETSF